MEPARMTGVFIRVTENLKHWSQVADAHNNIERFKVPKN